MFKLLKVKITSEFHWLKTCLKIINQYTFQDIEDVATLGS